MPDKIKVVVGASHSACEQDAKQLAQQLQLPIVSIAPMDADYLLRVTPSHVELVACHHPRFKPLHVDFLTGSAHHRRRFGGGRRQLLGRAIGVKPGYHPRVLDAAAGLGRDGFVLACLGCEVLMLERSPVIAALLDDGVRRALSDASCRELKMQVKAIDALLFMNQLNELECPEVIYLDPMFPARTKTSLVKKEMRLVKQLVGEDLDADALFNLACTKATRRVVVKRPRHALPLGGRHPDLAFEGRRNRFDVYLCLSRK